MVPPDARVPPPPEWREAVAAGDVAPIALVLITEKPRVVARGALRMLGTEIEGDRVAGTAGSRLDRDHHLRGTEPEEPSALDMQEPHRVLGIFDHRLVDGAYGKPYAIQGFPAPDILVVLRYHSVGVLSSPQCRNCHLRPPGFACPASTRSAHLRCSEGA